MRILDLFSGAGGSAKGYSDAGFEVFGVDVESQPHYPYQFYRGDVFTVGKTLIEDGGFDAIHASPPCQKYSIASRANGIDYPDLVEATRELLINSGLPYLMENVALSPLHNPTLVCGSVFGLGCEFYGDWYQLQRHRFFESNIPLFSPGPCKHTTPSVSIYGKPGGSSRARDRVLPGTQQWSEALRIDWMSGREMAQSVPPIYTEFLGKQLRERLSRGSERRTQPA